LGYKKKLRRNTRSDKGFTKLDYLGIAIALIAFVVCVFYLAIYGLFSD
jgi:hypothetical protein